MNARSLRAGTREQRDPAAARRQSCLVGVLLCVATVCHGQPASPPSDIDAARAADRCAPALERRQRINVGSGVYTEQAVVSAPLEIEIPLAIDAQRYGDCLVREGVAGGARVEAFVERAARCRRQRARGKVHIGQAGDGVRLGDAQDDAAFRACLEHAIDVEVLPDQP